MLQRNRSDISLSSREACTIGSIVVSQMLLPLLFPSCLLSLCYIILLVYTIDLPVSHSSWHALWATHTLLVHVIANFNECGCTNTFCFHRFSHVWFRDCLPIQISDEVGDANFCITKGFCTADKRGVYNIQ